MGLEIYADGIKLDLPDTVRVAFTFQVNNIAELKDRQSSFSNQFKAPKTPINDKALGFSSNPTSAEGLQFRKVPCIVVDDGLQTIPDGFLIVENFEAEYGLTIYAGTLNLFDGLEAKKIDEFTEISDRHFWSAAAARGSLQNPSNYRYFVADYGGTITGANIDAQFLLPWINRRLIWDKIFEGAGYTVTGNDHDTEELNDSYILAFKTNHPPKLIQSGMRVSDADSFTTYYNYIPATGFAPLFKTILSDPLAPLNPQIFPLEPIGYSVFFPTPPNVIDFSAFRCRIPGTYSIEWDIEMRSDLGVPPGPVYVNIYPGNEFQIRKISAGDSYFTQSTVLARFRADNSNGVQQPSGYYEQLPAGSEKLNKFSTKITLDVGDLIFLYADGHPLNGSFGDRPFTLGSRSEFRVVDLTEAPVLFGHYVDPWAMLPDITQKEFLKAIAQELGLTFSVDLMAKTCHVYNMKTVNINRIDAKDWSDRIINISTARHEYHPTSYARENFFKYKTGSEQSDTVGRGSFTIPDETLEDTKDVLTLIWGAVDMVPLLGQLLPRVKLYDADQSQWSEPNSPLVLISQTEATELAWSINGVALPASVPVAWFEIYGKDLNLGWFHLLNKFYPDFIAMLQNYLKTTVPVLLKPTDISGLDFSFPIYLSRFSAYFYLNKINQYRKNVPVKIELIRL